MKTTSKLIYCSHRFGGEDSNRVLAETKIKELQLNDPLNTYISPIHTFGFSYDLFPYDVGMNFCLSLLAKCDKLLVLSEPSEGVRREIEFATLNKIPIERKYVQDV